MSKKEFYPTLFQFLATDTQRNLIIKAGAGTGKTEVLTRRIIKILREEKLLLNQLLVMTFTDKASVEMKERIYMAVDRELETTGDLHFAKIKDTFLDNQISTFHSFCSNLLKTYPIEARIDPYFKVLDEIDKIFFLKKVITRSLKELSARTDSADLITLSHEYSKSELANNLYTIIQKREDVGVWINSILKTGWEEYRDRLKSYYNNFLTEIIIKLYRSMRLTAVIELLKTAVPLPENDRSSLSLKRLELLKLVPLLQEKFSVFTPTSENIADIIKLKNEIAQLAVLRGSPSSAWKEAAESYTLLQEAFYTLKYILLELNLEDYELDERLEYDGFKLAGALARTAEYCLDAYHQEKARENSLDFQDLQLKVLDLLTSPNNRHILTELREKYRYIMVDEFQDTNTLQWQIIRILAEQPGHGFSGNKVFIVGDEKQAIYSFRGGDVSLFTRARAELMEANLRHQRHKFYYYLKLNDAKNYEAEYRQKITDDASVRSGEIIFSDNFRSARIPVHFFNLFFNELLGQDYYEDYEAGPQRLVSLGNQRDGSIELLLVNENQMETDESIQISEAEDASATDGIKDPFLVEADLIAVKIREVLSGSDPLYEDVRERALKGKPAIAILLNRRTKLKVYEEALRRQKIDFIVVRGRGFYQRQEIVEIGNLFGFFKETTNDLYLSGFLRSAVGHVSDEGIFLLKQLDTSQSLWSNLGSYIKNIPAGNCTIVFSPEDEESLRTVYTNLKRWILLRNQIPLIDFLQLVIEEGGFYASFGRGARGKQAVSNLEKLLDKAREITVTGQEDVGDFTDWLNMRIDYIEDEGEADIDVIAGGSVQIMTVHQSKGLEFPMVIVPDLKAGFNLGERESLYCDYLTSEIKVDKNQIKRLKTQYEVGLEAPDRKNGYEPTPTLIKKIIRYQLKNKIIAEKKRLFYVAVTRAMDHLVLVGQINPTDYHINKILYTPKNLLTNWMDWIDQILSISLHANEKQGQLVFNSAAGEKLTIPYFVAGKSTGDYSQRDELEMEFAGL